MQLGHNLRERPQLVMGPAGSWVSWDCCGECSGLDSLYEIHQLFYVLGSTPRLLLTFKPGSHRGDGVSNVFQEAQRRSNHIYSYSREALHLEPSLEAAASEPVLKRAGEEIA